MYGRYRSPAGCSKLEHHSVCVTRPIIVRLMNYCFATLAIILLSPSVSATVHGTEIRLEIWPEPDLGKLVGFRICRRRKSGTTLIMNSEYVTLL